MKRVIGKIVKSVIGRDNKETYRAVNEVLEKDRFMVKRDR